MPKGEIICADCGQYESECKCEEDCPMKCYEEKEKLTMCMASEGEEIAIEKTPEQPKCKICESAGDPELFGYCESCYEKVA